MVDCPAELKRAYRHGRVIPFVGAGASMAISWHEGQSVCRGPSWRELVDQAARELGFDDPDLLRVRGTELQILEYFKLRNGDVPAILTNWLSRTMQPPDEAIAESALHRELAGLDRCRVFYTTNFDNFLERAFSIHGRPFTRVSVEAHMGRSDSACEIVKFHGDLDSPDQIVLSERDYERRLSLSTSLDLRLRADLLGRVVLFIGYSFRDPNVSYLFRLFVNQLGGEVGTYPGQRAYIAIPDPSDFERSLFQKRCIEVIAIDGALQAEDLAELLGVMK